MNGAQTVCVVGAACCFAAFLALGFAVSRRATGLWDRRIAVWRGGAVQLALVFTISGRSHALAWMSVAVAALFAIARWPLWIPAVVIASQVLSQATVHVLKMLYRRRRPDDWLISLDSGASYPSGHASTAMTFFGGWLIVVLFSTIPLPLKTVVGIGLVAWMIGIGWSRIALAAHYASDVLGGALFGSAWMCAVVALVLHVRRVP